MLNYLSRTALELQFRFFSCTDTFSVTAEMSSTMKFVRVFVKIPGVHMEKEDLVRFLNSVKFLKGKLTIGKCNVRPNQDDEGNKYTTAVATYSLVNNTKRCKDALEILIDRITTPSEHGWYISAGENNIFVIPDKKSGLTWTKRVGAYSTCYSSTKDDGNSTVSSVTEVDHDADEPPVPPEEDFPPLSVQQTPAKDQPKAVEQAAEQATQGNAPTKASAKAAEQAAEQAEEDIPRAFAIYLNNTWRKSFPTLELARAEVAEKKSAWDEVPELTVEIRGLIVGPVVE